MTQRPTDHKYEPQELDVSTLDDSEGQVRELDKCKWCGLPKSAHGDLADHPDEERLRQAEVKGATTLAGLARKASKALREHRRVDAVVLLTQLEVMVDNLRLAQRKAIDDQMKATRDG